MSRIYFVAAPMPLHIVGPMTSLDWASMPPGATPESMVQVPIKTLDAILDEANASTRGDPWKVFWKYYLVLPLRKFRNLSRRLRQPFKDRRASRSRSQVVEWAAYP